MPSSNSETADLRTGGQGARGESGGAALAPEPDGSWVQSVRQLIHHLGPHVHWRDFGRVPGRRDAPGSRAVALAGAAFDDLPYAFLDQSARQGELIDELARRHGNGSALAFRLLCLSEFIDLPQLEQVLPRAAIDELTEAELLIRQGERVAAAIRFVPYGDGYYLTDSLRLGDNRLVDGIQPVYLNFETHEQVLFLKRMLEQRPAQRALEVGCGTGLVTLELRDHVAQREGIDLHGRSVAFAKVNATLRGDSTVRFYQSDLLKEVSGKFDLIVFNPFKFTLETLGFARDFFDQCFEHLNPHGVVVLVFHAETLHGRDPVYREISRLLERSGRGATRTFFESALAAEGLVASVSFLAVERPTGVAKVSTRWDRQYFRFVLRCVYGLIRVGLGAR